MMVIDAKENVAGRLASKVAKAIIDGEKITVINAEELIIVGSKKAVMEKFKTRVNASVLTNPHYGPKYDRIPNKMFRRMVRNMLPTKKRAKERIIKQLRVYNTVPKGIDLKETKYFEEIKFNHRNNYMTLKEIALLLGGRW